MKGKQTTKKTPAKDKASKLFILIKIVEILP